MNLPAPTHHTVHTQPQQPLRVGLVGYGYAGRCLHAPLIRTTPGLWLHSVASRQMEVVKQTLGSGTRVLPDAEQLCSDPDIDLVVLASPNATHAPLAEAALRAGKAVVVDKPFALNAAQARPLVARAEQSGLLLSVFHNRRWDGDFLTVQALLAAGTLGPIRHAALHFDRYRPVVRQRWREAAGAGGGLFIDLMPHLLDQALQLFGPPVALSADIATLREGGQADDHAQLHLRYAQGLRVDLHASMLAAHPGPRFVLQGQRGAYRKWGLDAQEDALKAGQLPDPHAPEAWGADPQAGQLSLPTDPQQPEVLTTHDCPTQAGRWPAYYQGVAAAVRGQGPNPVSAASALQVMELLDLARQSHAARCELAVPELLRTKPTSSTAASSADHSA